ncbi:MAG: adenylate/guanylate cyclase domain-containing protein [Alphaproteobacteria bacterium]|nr:adenylate/guanylate cyclase domain-containing protein [Alphaproteobacteria bacterium]
MIPAARRLPRLAPFFAVAVALLVAVLTGIERAEPGSGAWAEADYALLDTWTRLAADTAPPQGIALVAIDDASLDAMPALVERREGMARLLDAIRAAGARSVAIDLFFTSPEQTLPPDLTADLGAWIAAPEPETPPVAADLLRRTHAETVGDGLLEAALKEASVTLAAHFGLAGTVPSDDRSLTRGTYAQVVPGDELPPSEPRMVASLPRFNAAAKRLGVISIPADPGGVRRIPLAKRYGPRHFVPFAFQALAAQEDVPRARMAFLGNEGTVAIGDRRITGSHNSMWLAWRHPSAYQAISVPAIEVVNGGPRAAELRDKLVLVGLTDLVRDTIETPWGIAPGVFVHAAAIDNALEGAPLVRASGRADALLAAGCGGLVALVFFAPGLRSGARFAAIALAAGVALGVPGWLRVSQGIWVGSVGPLLAVGLTSAAAVSVAWIQEGAQARELRRMFAHYVSDDLIEAMVADPSMVQVRGERRELSVLFSDIRDFTSFSEQLPPLELVAFLNAYLTPMTRAVLDHRGFVDKFIGDAVMALFGAPVPDPGHAVNACRTALAMFGALDAVRPAAERHGITLAIGVGVNTGEVAVGNMGSAERFEYTVLGDAVNLASRLEGLTKTYGVFCIVGPATAAALPAEFRLRRLDLVRVKGKAEPVEIFELCGDARVSVASYTAVEHWDSAIAAFRAGRFDEARSGFASFRAANPDDPVCATYLERLDSIGPVAPVDWDGVFTHTRK